MKNSILAYNDVVVVGLGQTGLSCVAWLQARGVTPLVMDTRENPPGAAMLPDGVKLQAGSLDQNRLCQADLIINSPGIALTTPAIAAAIDAGVEVIGDIELFARVADKPVIAITGSNGKSTVTELVGKMAAAAGFSVGVGGNIGLPALELLGKGHDLYVLELSSFQLETTFSLAPVAATILNVTEDHMDRYQGMDDYRQAKLRIYQDAKHLVINRDDPLTWPHDEVLLKSACSFGISGADFWLQSGALMKGETALIEASSMKLQGVHNQLNALAALALIDCAGIELAPCIETLKSYGGLPHRCEWVADKKQITWINDSKATNVGATLAALQGLKPQIKGRLHLIVGGEGKGADFAALSAPFAQYVDQLYCFGKDGGQLAQLKEGAHRVNNLDEAVALCAELGSEGDWVLLSPACASLDMYPNFMARGDHFRALVEAL